jgi:hypothetical protein
MTYLETLLLIENRGEITLGQDVRFIITNKHRYIRQIDTPENTWLEDTEPGKPEQHYGKEGMYYVWKRDELPATE